MINYSMCTFIILYCLICKIFAIIYVSFYLNNLNKVIITPYGINMLNLL